MNASWLLKNLTRDLTKPHWNKLHILWKIPLPSEWWLRLPGSSRRKDQLFRKAFTRLITFLFFFYNMIELLWLFQEMSCVLSSARENQVSQSVDHLLYVILNATLNIFKRMKLTFLLSKNRHYRTPTDLKISLNKIIPWNDSKGNPKIHRLHSWKRLQSITRHKRHDCSFSCC